MTVRVLGLASGVTSLEDHRHAIAALLTPSGSMQARGGLFPGAGGNLVAVSAMQAKVTAFYAWVDGGSAALQAGYDVASDADVTLTFADGEPSVARVDQVVIRIRDNTYDASGSTAGDVVIVKGNADGSAAALPASCELLWKVTVPAGASAGGGGINFATAAADQRRWTVAAGGLLPVTNQGERDAITAPYAGMGIWRHDRAWIEGYDGTAWRVQGVPIVSSVADLTAITNPIAGQVAWNTGEAELYAYVSGAWRRANWNEAWGVIGGKRRTSGANYSITITNTEVLTNMETGNVSLKNGRRYKINVQMKTTGHTTGDDFVFRIRENIVTGTQHGEYVWHNPNSAFGWTHPVVSAEYIATADATINFVLTCQRLGGTGSLDVNGGLPTNVTFIEVQDCGLASALTTV